MDYSEELRLLREALELVERLSNRSVLHSAILDNYGIALVDTNRVQESMPHLEKSNKIWEETVPIDHPMFVLNSIHLSEQYLKLRKYKQALKLASVIEEGPVYFP